MFKIQDTYNIIIVISLKITNICPYRIGYWYRLYFLPGYWLSVYRLKVISVQHYFILHCQHDSFPDPSCNFCIFVHNFSQGPSSNSHGSMQHYHRDSSPSLSCNFHGFVLHCQHDSFPDPSCNLHGFMHDFSPGLSFSCHGFVLQCQHSSSLDLLDTPPSFCQLSSDCLPRCTTRILHTFTLILCSHVHTF